MTRTAAKDFEAHRSFLAGLAYRMLGSIAEAEDVVQDAYLRWAGADASTVAHPRAFLARVVTRLCLDRMKSAASRREQYVGTWLPEPMVAAPAEPMADDLSVALLVTLERLSPLERAAFLLHEVFDMDYGEPVRGKQNILRLFAAIAAERRLFRRDQLERASINGLPGFVMHAEDGVQTTAFEVAGDQIVALYIVRNPDKLRHLAS